MRRKLTCLLIVMLLLTLLTPAPVSAQDFGPTLKTLTQVRPADADQISITVTGENFSVSLDDDMAQPKVLGTFPLTQWPAFIEEAVKYGLREYRRSRYGDTQHITLTFLSPQNTKLSMGRQELNLPRSFFDYMIDVPEFPRQTGKNGFAILLYDPHSAVSARYELVPALNLLVRSNPALKFTFLNEGEYEKEDRSIPFNGLDEEFKKLPANAHGNDSRSALIYTLLQRYLIDCAMAYRLLYDAAMPSRAIDDNPSLAKEDEINEGLKKEDGRQWSLLDSIREIRRKVEVFLSTSPAVTAQQRSIGDELFKAIKDHDDHYFATYGGRTRTSRDVAVTYQKVASLLARILELAEKLQQAAPDVSINDEIASLKRRQNRYKLGAEFQQGWAVREAVMADQIIQDSHFTSPNVPIAFLGPVHLDGITEELTKKGIGYAVFSPRSMMAFGDIAERDTFERFVSPTKRAAYLKDATQWNKGPVALTAAEVATVIRPFLRQGAAKFHAERVVEREAFVKQTDFTVDYDKVAGATSANAVLAQASIAVETFPGGAPPVDVPPRAVAYYERASGAGRSRLVILEPRNPGWRGASGQARYETLRNVPLEYSPAKYAYDSAYGSGSDYIKFFELPGGQRAATVSDLVKGRTYIISGGPATMSDVLTIRPNSRPKGGSNTLIRVLVTELEPKRERKSTTNGE